MKPRLNPSLRIAVLASLASAVSVLHAADVTLSAGTYTDTQVYDNGTITGNSTVATFDSAANYTFNGNLTLTSAWNRVTLNTGAALSVAGPTASPGTGILSTDIGGVSLNGGTLTTGGLNLQNFFYDWAGSYNDGKVSIPFGRSIINGSTIVATQDNAGFIQFVPVAAFPGYSNDILYLGNDGATINSAGFNIGVTMRLQDWSGQSGSLTKTGPGTLSLTTANSYSGGTTVEAGTLSLGNGTNNTNLSDTATVEIKSGATLNLNFTGSDTVGALIINNVTVPGGTYNSAHPTYGSYFTGNGSLSVFAELDQNGTWTATTDGSWETGSNWQSNLIAAGADRSATFSAGTGSESITVTLEAPRTIGTLAFSNANYTIAGSPTLTMESSATPVISVATGASATIAANLGGSFGLEKTGPGLLTLSGVKSYSGGTTVTGGTLAMGSIAATGYACPVQGALTVNSGATLRLDDVGFGFGAGGAVGTVTLNTGTLVVNAAVDVHMGFNGQANLSLADGSSITSGTPGNTLQFATKSVNSIGDSQNILSANMVLRPDGLPGQHTFSVDDGAAATDLLVSGNLSDRFPLVPGETASLTKTGSGTMVLGGTNTYYGNTAVNDGALNVSASGSLLFRPAGNGSNNSVSGSASASLSFLGTVSLDLGAADATIDNSWTLFNLPSFSSSILAPTAVTSTLGSFSEVSAGIWELPVTGAKWVFTEADGKLAYVSATNTYANWAATNAPGQTPAQDYDNDGVENGVEYFMGVTTPGFTANPAIVSGTISWPKSATFAGSYAVQTSPDLSTWTKVPGGSLDLTDPAFVRYSPAPGLGKVFVRISVTPN